MSDRFPSSSEQQRCRKLSFLEQQQPVVRFSSRRGDGLYTRPYICYLDANGVPGKPFLLPQKETDYYERSLFSFNIPELIRGKIKVDTYKLIDISKYGEAVRLK